MSNTKSKAALKQLEPIMEEDEDAVFVVFNDEAGTCNRRPVKSELEQLAVLGYPIEEKDDWYLKVSNSDANPGRGYWSYKFAWVGWVDEVPKYNQDKMEKKLSKKQRDYKRYLLTQGLPLPEDLDVPKGQDLQELRHEIEELKKQIIILRADVGRLKGDKVLPSAFRSNQKQTLFPK